MTRTDRDDLMTAIHRHLAGAGAPRQDQQTYGKGTGFDCPACGDPCLVRRWPYGAGGDWVYACRCGWQEEEA